MEYIRDIDDRASDLLIELGAKYEIVKIIRENHKYLIHFEIDDVCKIVEMDEDISKYVYTKKNEDTEFAWLRKEEMAYKSNPRNKPTKIER